MAGVASECDLCIVYNTEASAWRDYIMQLVTQFVAGRSSPALRIRSVDDASLTKTGCRLPRSSIVIVVLSPGHLDFLRRHQNVVNYRTLVDHHATNALVLRCGVVSFSDLADQDSSVFNQFFGWTKLEEINNGEPVTKAVGLLLSRRSVQDERVYVTPDKVLSRPGFSTSTPRPRSNTSDPPSNRSSNRSSGGWKTTPSGDSVFVETSDDVSTTPHFRVIPTTIRCEVRSTGFMKTLRRSAVKGRCTNYHIIP